jgi:hypothetical protein
MKRAEDDPDFGFYSHGVYSLVMRWDQGNKRPLPKTTFALLPRAARSASISVSKGGDDATRNIPSSAWPLKNHTLRPLAIAFTECALCREGAHHTEPRDRIVFGPLARSSDLNWTHRQVSFWHSGDDEEGAKPVGFAPVVQTSTCSAMARASSTSMPRYLTVLSIFVCPNSSCTARKLPVRR